MRMKTKPTRISRVGGKNFAESLPTRRRRATTTHDARGEWAKHSFRIGAANNAVKQGACAAPARTHLFCIANARDYIACWAGIRDLSTGDFHEQAGAAAGNGAVGCFYFQSARGQ